MTTTTTTATATETPYYWITKVMLDRGATGAEITATIKDSMLRNIDEYALHARHAAIAAIARERAAAKATPTECPLGGCGDCDDPYDPANPYQDCNTQPELAHRTDAWDWAER